jgi:hypothetical protein
MSIGVSFAKGGDDKEKDTKKEKDNPSIVSKDKDSVYTDADVNAAHHVDDTLVFEDWDGQGGGSGDDGGIGESNGGAPNLDGNKDKSGYDFATNSTAENLKNVYEKVFQKEYRVEFTVYPNPTVDHITIQPNIIPQSIRITDITGKTHRDQTYTSRLDVADLPSGTYVLSLIYADHIEARRFIKR